MSRTRAKQRQSHPAKWARPNVAARLIRKPKPRTAVALVILGALAVVVIISLWNYLGVSLPTPAPTTRLDGIALQAGTGPGLAAPPAGIEAWSFHFGEALSVPPLAVGNRVYFVAGATAETGRVVALDAESGKVVWMKRLGSIADYPPNVAGDWLYVGARGGSLLALDRHTGQERWSFKASESILGQPHVEGGVVYFASGAVYALDAATGKQRWKHEVGGHVTRAVAVSQGVVAAVSADGNLNLIDAAHGKRRLTFPLWFATSAAPVISGQTVAVAGGRANVQALALRERDIPMEKALRYWWTKLWVGGMASRPPLPQGYLWQRRDIGGVAVRPMAADADRIFLGVQGNDQTDRVIALDKATGETLWQSQFDSLVTSTATLTGGLLLVGTNRGQLYALEAASGERAWLIAEASPVGSAPAVAGALVIVPGIDGTLRAFR